MNATIDFYGLCLFVWEKARVRVLLPKVNATSSAREVIGNGEHYAKFLDYRTDTKATIKSWDLDGGAVHIDVLSQATTRRAPRRIEELIDLGMLNRRMRLKNESDLETVATTIVLEGGRWERKTQARYGRNAYMFAKKDVYGPPDESTMPGYRLHAPVCAMRWVADGVTDLTCTRLRKGATIEKHPFRTAPGAPRQIVIGNVCDESDPVKWRCTDRTDAIQDGWLWDEDFQWFYELFETLDGKTIPAGERLIPCIDVSLLENKWGCLAPFGWIFDPRAGTTSTCYNGQFCPGGDCDDG